MLKNTKLHILSFNLLMILIVGLFIISAVYAADERDAEITQEATTAEPMESVGSDSGAAEPPADEETEQQESELSSESFGLPARSGGGGDGYNEFFTDLTIRPIQVSPGGNSGAAMTNIPIAVPSGRKGIQPNLALNYSSSARNGWIGVGWNLDMGAIQRNTKRGVDYDADDYVASMNGSASELVARGDWGTNYYGAKIEGAFSQYYKDPSGGWVVTTKDGTKYYYGTTADSRQDDPTDASRVFKWCLDRVEDTNGNYMTVTYDKDIDPDLEISNNQLYLERIDYTGNTSGLGTSNYVQFYTEARIDVSLMYISNFKVKIAKRLKTIEVVSNSNTVRAYALTYTTSLGTSKSLLESVQQYGNDALLDGTGTVTEGTALPAINTTYATEGDGEFGTKINDPHTTGAIAGNYTRTQGDINGDGMADTCLIKGGGSNIKFTTRCRVSNGDGTFQPEVVEQHSGDLGDVYTHMLGDITGDGMADACVIKAVKGENFVTRCVVSNGNGTFGDIQVSYGSNIEDFYTAMLGDVNGDGMADACVIKGGGDARFTTRCMLSNGNGTFGDQEETSGEYLYGPVNRYTKMLGDVNGDGMADACAIKGGSNTTFTTQCMLSNGNGTFQLKEATYGEVLVNDVSLYTKMLGDVNGDGMADACVINGGSGLRFTTRCMLSKGDGTFQPDEVTDSEYVLEDVYTRMLGDINGDGMVDACLTKAENGENFVTRCMLSSGDGTFGSEVYQSHGAHIGGSYTRMLSDIDGDGMADACLIRGGNNLAFITQCVLSNGDRTMLDSIDNGIGGTTILEYEPSSSYENQVLPFVVQTLSTVTINDGNGNDMVTEYDYSGGNFEFEDREFRGFEFVTAKTVGDTANESLYTTTKFHQDDIYKGRPDEQTSKDGAEEPYNIYTKSVNTYDYAEPVADLVYFPRLRQKDDYICDGNCTETNKDTEAFRSKIELDYDDYGNIEEKRSYGKVSLATLDKKEHTDHYLPGEIGAWLVSLPKQTYIENGAAIKKAETKYNYYLTTGNLQTEEKWLDTDGSYLTTSYQYDTYGNAEYITDPRDIVTKLEYDATNTFPEKVINDYNGLGFFTQTTYDSVFIDKVHIETDYNGNQTQYDYDEFGRIDTVTKPYPYGITKYTYDDVNQIKTVELKDRSGGVLQTQVTYHDGLGRAIQTRNSGIDVTTIIVDTAYNERGQVALTSNPYFEGELPGNIYDTTYTYDALGRRIETLNPDDTFSLIGYDRGWEIYIDANSHQKMVQKDIYGQIVNVDEYTGEGPYELYATTTYDYDVLGNLTSVMDAASPPNVTTINYDSLSRKKNMDDPDMGFWQYEYDANGSLKNQTDAKDQIITFDDYDALNRVTQKNYPDNSYITYDYDLNDDATDTNAKGRLTKVTEVNAAHTTTLITKTRYDEIGNVTQTDRELDGETYTFKAEYDVLERIWKKTYPDTIEVEYTYDGHGNIERIFTGASTYITYDSYNAFAQPLHVTFGNGITTDYTYYPENNRLETIITTSPMLEQIMNLTYVITDDQGYINTNIMQIIDNLDADKTRTFKYDELDRLTEAVSPSYGGTIVYQYDEIGNMTYNCRVGHYIYYPDHPHAVKEIRRTDGTRATKYGYDANGNMTISDEYDKSEVFIEGKSRTITYNFDNMPVSIITGETAAVSQYDAYGTRVRKDSLLGTTRYIGPEYECTDNVCTKNIISGTQLITSITGTETFYYHTDHLGSSSIITDSDDAGEEVVQEIYYYPYGEIKENTTPEGEDVNLRYKYTGKEWDAESGLYYYGARYYDPKLARFISADTIVPLPFHPVSLNRYAYVFNNPIVLRDLDGHEPTWKFVNQDPAFYDDPKYFDYNSESSSSSNIVVVHNNNAQSYVSIGSINTLSNIIWGNTGYYSGGGSLSGASYSYLVSRPFAVPLLENYASHNFIVTGALFIGDRKAKVYSYGMNNDGNLGLVNHNYITSLSRTTYGEDGTFWYNMASTDSSNISLIPQSTAIVNLFAEGLMENLRYVPLWADSNTAAQAVANQASRAIVLTPGGDRTSWGALYWHKMNFRVGNGTWNSW